MRSAARRVQPLGLVFPLHRAPRVRRACKNLHDFLFNFGSTAGEVQRLQKRDTGSAKGFTKASDGATGVFGPSHCALAETMPVPALETPIGLTRLLRGGMRLKILHARPKMRLPNKFKLLGHTSEPKPMPFHVANPRLPYFAPSVYMAHGNTKSCKIFQITFQREEMKIEAVTRRLKPKICQRKIEKRINLLRWQSKNSSN